MAEAVIRWSVALLFITSIKVYIHPAALIPELNSKGAAEGSSQFYELQLSDISVGDTQSLKCLDQVLKSDKCSAKTLLYSSYSCDETWRERNKLKTGFIEQPG